MLRFILLAAMLVATSRADVLNLVNGDRYLGDVELVTKDEVHLKSEIVGTLKIPRAKVASIFFGTNQPPAALPAVAKKDEIDPKAIDQVQREFLSTAGPEANAMFTDLVQGLSTGKLSIDDLRTQARDSLAELRALQSEIGEEADNPLISSYVGILEKFINQGSTNKAKASAPKPKSAETPE